MSLRARARGVRLFSPPGLDLPDPTRWQAPGLASCIWHSVDSLRIPPSSVVIRSFDPPMYQELNAVHREEHDLPAKVLLLDVLRQFAELVGH